MASPTADTYSVPAGTNVYAGFTAPGGSATAFTLSVQSPGLTGVPSTITVTPNGPVPTGGATVTLAIASGGGSLGTTTLNFSVGATAGQMTTVLRGSDGTTTITMTNNAGLGNNGSGSTFVSTTSSTVATVTLVPTATASAVPFVFGHTFRKGDIPSGSSIQIAGTAVNAQATIKSTWPDGSARSAIISGTADLTNGVNKTLTLSAGAAASGTALTTADLIATGVTTDVMTGAFHTANFGATEWASPFTTWVSGPRMSSWIYRKPIGFDEHLVAWMEVRLFAGGAVEILPWVENGYLRVAGATNKNTQYLFRINGTQREMLDIDLKSRQRAPLLSGTKVSHWLGTAPSVSVIHDIAYLKASRLFLDYQTATPTNAVAITGLPSTFTPLQQGGYPAGMGSGGYHASIGPVPEWDAIYATAASDSVRPGILAAIERQGYSAGRYGIHFRDEATNRPLRFSQWPTLCTNGSTGISNTGNSSVGLETVAGTGGAAPTYTNTHAPAMGAIAYALTGRFFHLETLQFQACANYLKQGDTTRLGSSGVFMTSAGANTTRGVAWAWRTLAQAAAFTPDADALKAEFVASYNANVNWYHARYVAQTNCPQGFVQPYSDYSPPASGTTQGGSTTTNVILAGGDIYDDDDHYVGWELVIGGQTRTITAYVGATLTATVSPAFTVAVASQPFIVREDNLIVEALWMQDFVTFAMGYGLLLDINADQAQITKDIQLFHWKARSVIGRFGTAHADHYNSRDAAQYTLALAPSDSPDWAGGTGPWFATWGALQTAHELERGSFGTREAGPLRGGNFPDATSYWGNLMPALALAVEHGVAGAVEAWRRLTEASNYSTLAANFGGSPVWGVQPYGGHSRPAWVTAVPVWTWSELANTALANTPPSITVSPGQPSAKMHAWCGATVRIKGSHYMLGAAGGHGDYAGNETNSLMLNQVSPAWSEPSPPSPTSQVYNGTPFYADFRPASAHTYWMTQYLNTQDRMFIGPRGGISYPQFPDPPAEFAYAPGTDRYPKALNWRTKQWEAPGFVAMHPTIGSSDHALCFKHPYTDDVYVSPSYDSTVGWTRWASVANTWTKLSSASAAPWYAGSACDPTRNRVLVFGGFSANVNPRLLDLNGSGITVTFTGLGPTELWCNGYPGGDYDEMNDQFVIAFNKDDVIEVRTCTAGGLVVADPNMGGTKPSARPNGVHNSFRYVPELGIYVVANNYNQNVKWFRTS